MNNPPPQQQQNPSAPKRIKLALKDASSEAISGVNSTGVGKVINSFILGQPSTGERKEETEGNPPKLRLVLPKLASKQLGSKRSATIHYHQGMYAEDRGDYSDPESEEDADWIMREDGEDEDYEDPVEVFNKQQRRTRPSSQPRSNAKHGTHYAEGEDDYAYRDMPLAQHRVPDQDDPSSFAPSHFLQDDSSLPLKPDHKERPLYVCRDGRIILESFHPLQEQAVEFLITIGEPITRTSRIHEYKITPYSLYAAVSVGMETAAILGVLERLCKTHIPERLVSFIRECTDSFGKVKLVLKQNKYYIESSYPEILRKLLQDPIIADARDLGGASGVAKLDAASTVAPGPVVEVGDTGAPSPLKEESDQFFGAVINLDSMEEDNEALLSENVAAGGTITLTGDLLTQSFLIKSDAVEGVRRRCGELDFPLMEEYDFRNDDVNPSLDIDLSPKTLIRDYQEVCLSKMFAGGRGRARSGIIVLPTGAGKTLVGITAACTIKKSVLVLCTNAISVEQWTNEFKKWSSIASNKICKFTAESKSKFQGNVGILVSTYTMISHSGKRAWDTQRMLEFINSQEWGLLILDEVHVVPANVFRKVLTTVAAHTKMGLTATLVREDDKIEDLNFLIGPKLYEANWLDLANRGHIAKVEATEIWCPMTGDFYEEYLKCSARKRRLLCVMNPMKFMATEYLIKWRESLGDKIIVFSDNVFALAHYAVTMKRPYIYGATSHEERKRILHHFREGHPMFQTLFLSKVGDMSLDLPEATCLIQISSQFGSRRQEAQRMGRILRAKRRHEQGFRARFYTLVSQDTDEVMFSARRKRFLIDQGYEFRIISKLSQLIPPEEQGRLQYAHTLDQSQLLKLVKEQHEGVGEDELEQLREGIHQRKDEDGPVFGGMDLAQVSEHHPAARLRKERAAVKAKAETQAGQGRHREANGTSSTTLAASSTKSSLLFRSWKRGKTHWRGFNMQGIYNSACINDDRSLGVDKNEDGAMGNNNTTPSASLDRVTGTPTISTRPSSSSEASVPILHIQEAAVIIADSKATDNQQETNALPKESSSNASSDKIPPVKSSSKGGKGQSNPAQQQDIIIVAEDDDSPIDLTGDSPRQFSHHRQVVSSSSANGQSEIIELDDTHQQVDDDAAIVVVDTLTDDGDDDGEIKFLGQTEPPKRKQMNDDVVVLDDGEKDHEEPQLVAFNRAPMVQGNQADPDDDLIQFVMEGIGAGGPIPLENGFPVVPIAAPDRSRALKDRWLHAMLDGTGAMQQARLTELARLQEEARLHATAFVRAHAEVADSAHKRKKEEKGVAVAQIVVAPVRAVDVFPPPGVPSPSKVKGCPICKEPFSSGQKLSATVCGHIFCESCIVRCLQACKQCPICRKLLKGKASHHPLYLS